MNSGHWPLYRYDPRRVEEGLNPLQLDSKAPTITIEQYESMQNRFNILIKSQPERAGALLSQAQSAVKARFEEYSRRAAPYTNGQ